MGLVSLELWQNGIVLYVLLIFSHVMHAISIFHICLLTKQNSVAKMCLKDSSTVYNDFSFMNNISIYILSYFSWSQLGFFVLNTIPQLDHTSLYYPSNCTTASCVFILISHMAEQDKHFSVNVLVTLLFYFRSCPVGLLIPDTAFLLSDYLIDL